MTGQPETPVCMPDCQARLCVVSNARSWTRKGSQYPVVCLSSLLSSRVFHTCDSSRSPSVDRGLRCCYAVDHGTVTLTHVLDNTNPDGSTRKCNPINKLSCSPPRYGQPSVWNRVLKDPSIWAGAINTSFRASIPKQVLLLR
jgi:hypothetical protein